MIAMTSAYDVAAEIRGRRALVDNFSLHKLLFYAQGFHLAWTRRPLFEQRIEAWDDGPVVADLWRGERHGLTMPGVVPLTEEGQRVVDNILSRYGQLSAAELITLSHVRGGPWDRVYEHPAESKGHNEITCDLMQQWFSEDSELIALRAQADASGERWRAIVTRDSVPGLASAVERVLGGNASSRRPLAECPCRDKASEIQ
jgi:uncharacterized phage-associated protein